jgi:hypothetical protein
MEKQAESQQSTETTEEILIWCSCCRKQIELDHALMQGWKYCNTCCHFTCADCLHDTGNKCYSDLCRNIEEQPQLTTIPVEKIVLFSKTNQNPIQQMDKDSLIFKLFYRDEYIKNTPFEVLHQQAEAEVKTTEEIWRAHGIVITKRRRGKFISWEKLSN